MSSSRTAYWILQTGGWTLYAFAGAVIYNLFADFSWKGSVLPFFGSAFLFLSTHVFQREARRRGWTRLPLKRLIPRLLAGTFLIATASQIFVSLVLLYVLRLAEIGTFSFTILLLYIFQTEVILCLWAFAFFGYLYFRNYQRSEIEKWRLQAAARDAELLALKTQIRPHFLFNCLNNIRALVLEDPGRARVAITELSDLLRYTLQVEEHEWVSLRDEIEMSRAYLGLEALHLEERMQVDWQVDESVLDARIPPMALQIMVENAVKHGVAKTQEAGLISIVANQAACQLCVCVKSPGTIGPSSDSRRGLGIRNLKERMRIEMGQAAGFVLEKREEGGVQAVLRMPFLVAEGEQVKEC